MRFDKPKLNPARILNCTKHPITLHDESGTGVGITLPANPNPIRVRGGRYCCNYLHICGIAVQVHRPKAPKAGVSRIIGLPDPDPMGPILLIVSKPAAAMLVLEGQDTNPDYIITAPAMQVRDHKGLVVGARSLDIYSTWTATEELENA